MIAQLRQQLSRPRVQRVMFSVLMAIAGPVGYALMNLTASDLEHPGTWLAAAVVAVAGSVGALLHAWAQDRK